jgi:uncharacterized OB-fold protein
LTTQQQPTSEEEKKPRPIVPYLRLPESPGEAPYLWGSKCRSCGAAFMGKRIACSRCMSREFEEIRLSNQGELYTFTVIHQSFPGMPTPYIAATVDLPEGVSVRATVTGLDANNPALDWLGKKVEMYTEKVYSDKQGNDVIAYRFRPVEGS